MISLLDLEMFATISSVPYARVELASPAWQAGIIPIYQYDLKLIIHPQSHSQDAADVPEFHARCVPVDCT